jgi:16S rRNA (uracil1498-N3)-methyltransferase
MEYYFTNREKVNLNDNTLVIDDFEFKHLVKVLRKKTGDKIIVTDGERNIYHCEIVLTDKAKMVCKILKKEFNMFDPEVNLSLYISPLRNLSRFEFAIEKASTHQVTRLHRHDRYYPRARYQRLRDDFRAHRFRAAAQLCVVF